MPPSSLSRRCRRNYGGAPGPGMKDEQGSVTSGGVTVCDRGPPNTHTTFGFLRLGGGGVQATHCQCALLLSPFLKKETEILKEATLIFWSKCPQKRWGGEKQAVAAKLVSQHCKCTIWSIGDPGELTLSTLNPVDKEWAQGAMPASIELWVYGAMTGELLTMARVVL
ncbi:hypothetical protein NQZ68_033466 [Dissostichus eleginoides]|nr:hypothetical protein NQZ68_033466 [Dissostichus eleginoides]